MKKTLLLCMVFFINSECGDNQHHNINKTGCMGAIFAKMKNFIKIPASYCRYFYKKCTKKEKSLHSSLIIEKTKTNENIKSNSCVQEMIRLDSLNTRINL